MGFKLKDGSGVEHTYDQKKLKIPSTTEGETVVFTEGEAQAEKTVDISANGAFEVEPDEGFAFVKKVSGNIAVPAPVTSVNGQTGDVKTSMVVNFTLDTAQSQDITVDVPFADVLAVINANPQNPPYIRFTFDEGGDVWTFAQYRYDSEYQAIFVYGGYLTTYNAFGLSIMLMWTSDSVKSADVSTSTPVVFDLDSDDNSVSVRYPNGFIPDEFSVMGLLEFVVTGNVPSMVVIDGETEAMYSGTSTTEGLVVIFASPYIDGKRKVVKGSVNTANQTITWSVDEEQLIPKVHIVHADIHIGGESTADATFQEIKSWMDNGETVLVQTNGGILQYSAAGSNNSNFVFSYIVMVTTGFLMARVTINESNGWSGDYIDCTTGFQYESPSGKKFRLAVADDGTLSTVEIKS